MRGDPRLGAMARSLRISRGLTLAVAARRAGCSPSLLSQVETGLRVLQIRLAQALDAALGSGGTLTALADAAYAGYSERPDAPSGLACGDGELILVRIPRRGLTVPISRRELLAALGIGAL